MEEVPYTKREQDVFQREIFGRFDAQDKMFAVQNKTLERIEIQALKTNGRATALEAWSNETKAVIEKLLADNTKLKTDRTRIYTIISVLVVVCATIGFLFYNLIDLKIQTDENTRIPIAVSSGIDDYFSAHFSKTQIINNNN